jgi:hypothetical protein
MKCMYDEYEIFCSSADKKHGTKDNRMEIREVGKSALLNVSIVCPFR